MNEGIRPGSGGRLGGPFDRLATAERTRGIMLNDSVGDDAENDFDDMREAKRALARIGYYPAERARFPSGHTAMIADPDFQNGIRMFQRATDLKVDGLIRPGGETERAIGKTIEPEARSISGRLRSDLGITTDDGPEPEDRLSTATARANTPAQTAQRSGAGAPSVSGRPRHKPQPLPPLPTLRDPFVGRASEMRGEDKRGSGQFGSPRIRFRNGKRMRESHEGIDIAGTPGENVRAMATGRVIKVGGPYTDFPSYRTVEIKTPGGYIVRQFYVSPSVKVGDEVTAGRSVIGKLQDLKANFPGMTNQVHVEVRDPRNVIYPNRTQGSSSRFQEFNPTSLFESGQRIPHP